MQRPKTVLEYWCYRLGNEKLFAVAYAVFLDLCGVSTTLKVLRLDNERREISCPPV